MPKPGPRIVQPCTTCGATVERLPADIRRNKTGRVFCTNACRFLAQSGAANGNHGRAWPAERRAAMAAKKMGTPAWNRGLTAETSETVQRLAQAQIGNTRGRGNGGKPAPATTARNLSDNPMKREDVRRTVSLKVRGRYGALNPNWRGGRSRYRGFAWPLASWLAARRDLWRCRVCGNRAKRLNAHHIIPYATNPDNSVNNLVTLCCGCHNRVEAGKIPCPTNRQLPAIVQPHPQSTPD